MKLTFKFKNTETLSTGLPVYKDDTEIGKIESINKETGDVVVNINGMFDNWVKQTLNSNQPIGVSTKKQPRKL